MAISTGTLLVTVSLTFIAAFSISHLITSTYLFNKYEFKQTTNDVPMERIPTERNDKEKEEVAVALPSIIVEDNLHRDFYGGKGDKPHLGGFTNIDFDGLSPRAWKVMLEDIGVKSLLDLGCGKGISTTYFESQGVDVLCAEGSHDAVTQSLLPSDKVVEHDFSRGPWWPVKNYDAVWCVEFLEHVGRNYHKNYFPALKKAALVFATHSNWGGWHHVEVHNDDWWITKFQMHGFVYSEYLTKMIRGASGAGREDPIGDSGKKFHAQHIWLSMMVFINPSVASLPQHHHLLSEKGCYKSGQGPNRINRDCGNGREESELPESYKPIQVDEAKFANWTKFLVDAVLTPKQEKKNVKNRRKNKRKNKD